MSRNSIPPLLVLVFLLSISCAYSPILDLEVVNTADHTQAVEFRARGDEWITMTADLPPGGSANLRARSKSPEGSVLTSTHRRDLAAHDNTRLRLEAGGRLVEQPQGTIRCD